MKIEKNFIPAQLPVRLGYEENGKWYAISESSDNSILVGNSEDDNLERMSFLQYARLVNKHSLRYLLPDGEHRVRQCEILCPRKEMLAIALAMPTTVYCTANDRTYTIISRKAVLTDGDFISPGEMPQADYVIHPFTYQRNREPKNRKE